jgi:hypothetical protein
MIDLVQFILAILPNVAQTPQSIVDGGQWVINTITGVISVLSMIYTPVMLAAIMIVIVGMFTFEWIYHTTMWVVRKIPMINMK